MCNQELPPGQRARSDFPRFGLSTYAKRFPSTVNNRLITVDINHSSEFVIDLASQELPRTSMTSNFHCVSTWSYVGANWAGVKFADFYKTHIQHLEHSDDPIVGAVLYAQDGFKTTLLLEDLLGEDVMLADTLDSQPLPVKHGAPVRLVAPQHYGYKNLKHLKRIEFYSTMPVLKRGVNAFLDHPRARVNLEERGRWVPGWILRFVYRPVIAGTVKQFHDAMSK